MNNTKLKRLILKIRLAVRRTIGGKRLRPSFIIVGAQKAGTTSLYKYLTQHPEIEATLEKEVHYFDLNYDKPLSWYQSFFPLKKNNGKITGEASPYYMFHPYAIKRIADFNSDMKIIVLLREPASRAISHYYHEVRLGRETLGMREAFNRENERMDEELEKFKKDQYYIGYNHQRFSYQSRGDYSSQIKEIIRYFKQENIKIIDSKEFFKHTSETVSDVLKFLDVDPTLEIKTEKKFNAWEKKADPEEKEIKAELKTKFENSNEDLFDLIGQKFNWN